MKTDTVDALVGSKRGVVTAAAGCGKTEAIALAVRALGPTGRQLVLTHTHAGVAALKRRMAKLQVPPTYYRIDTIAAWCLRYASHYPRVSGMVVDSKPTGAAWNTVYGAAKTVINVNAVRDVLAASYAGVFVDEYQDCTLRHHDLVMALAGVLPCRILGDPMQGIFDFNEPVVHWATHVEPHFEALPPLETPWRWKQTPALGKTLMDIRERLKKGDKVDLKAAPLQWQPLPSVPQQRISRQRQVCMNTAKKAGSIVALRKWASECHQIAQGLNGTFTCMEEMDCKDLLKHAQAIESGSGFSRVNTLIKLATDCMAGVATPLKPFSVAATQNKLPTLYQQTKYPAVAAAISSIGSSSTLSGLVRLMSAIEAMPEQRLYRRELWIEMRRAIEDAETNPDVSLVDAAWQRRNRARYRGRMVEHRTLSRTLLVKGLEFAHCLVLDAADFDVRNFYVAITRPYESLTICSQQSFKQFAAVD